MYSRQDIRCLKPYQISSFSSRCHSLHPLDVSVRVKNMHEQDRFHATKYIRKNIQPTTHVGSSLLLLALHKSQQG